MIVSHGLIGLICTEFQKHLEFPIRRCRDILPTLWAITRVNHSDAELARPFTEELL